MNRRGGGSALLALALLLFPSVAHSQVSPTTQQTLTSAAVDPGVEFNDLFLRRTRGAAVDVSLYRRGNPVPAGRYIVDVTVNDKWLGRREIMFVPAGDTAEACFDAPTLSAFGLDLAKLKASATDESTNLAACQSLPALVSGAVVKFSVSDQSLQISLPQVALLRNPRGYVDPRFWDQGENALIVGYNATIFNTRNRGLGDVVQAYLGLNVGVNLGAWRFRHNGALIAGSGPHARAHYQNQTSYIQRDITPLKSQIVIGEAFTGGEYFDSIGFRGVRLSSDDRMLPESQRGYAPIVRGVARSNANVIIRQNGNILYQSVVAPGPFEINDLYATGYGGDLSVTVNEADGRSETFTIPYAATPQMIRRGVTRFSLVGGVVRDVNTARAPAMMEATVQHGFSNAWTGYAGITVAGAYKAVLVGGALNTRLGALGVDVTAADAGLRGMDSRGQSVRVSYSKLLPNIGTNFSIAAYRYSSKGYWSLRDALLAYSVTDAGRDPGAIDRRRGTFQITVNQALGGAWGTFYVTGSSQNYWNRKGADTFYQAGYSNRIGRVGYSLNASRQMNDLTKRSDDRIVLGFNFALSRRAGAPNASVTFASEQGRLQAQAMLNGTAGQDRDINWGVAVAHQNDNESISGNIQHQARFANLTASTSTGAGFSQMSAGATGSIIVHSGGVTLGATLGESAGLVHAPGAAGARITNAPGVRIDRRGYAIVPYMTAYARNTVEIDPKGLPLDIELHETSRSVAPRAGALVLLEFDAISGQAMIIRARVADGTVLPFGASILNAQNEVIGQVGQAGRAFVRGQPVSGELLVRWGDGAFLQCRLRYQPTASSVDRPMTYAIADGICRPSEHVGSALAVVSHGNEQP